MNASTLNPFPADPERREIWDMLMRRDFEAFVMGDWSILARDFLEAEFLGIDACRIANPDHWRLNFPTVASYRDEWLRQAAEFKETEFVGKGKLELLFESSVLRDIEIVGDRALAHKKFNGNGTTVRGMPIRFLWQSVYFLKRVGSQWRITGFVGYLPNPIL